MSEQAPKTKSYEEVTAQLGRIAGKLAERAIESDLVDKGSSPMIGKMKLGERHLGVRLATSTATLDLLRKTDETHTDEYSLDLHEGRVRASKIRTRHDGREPTSLVGRININEYGPGFIKNIDGKYKEISLNPRQEIAAAANIAGTLRGEIAAREIATKQQETQEIDDFVRS